MTIEIGRKADHDIVKHPIKYTTVDGIYKKIVGTDGNGFRSFAYLTKDITDAKRAIVTDYIAYKKKQDSNVCFRKVVV